MHKGQCKSVDPQKFIDSINAAIQGAKQTEAAKMCGLSVPTWARRVNQYFAPDRFGEIPEGFFSEVKEVPKEEADAPVRYPVLRRHE